MRRLFLAIVLISGFAAQASAQQAAPRYDEFMTKCPERARVLRPANKVQDSVWFDNLTQEAWQRLKANCVHIEATMPKPPTTLPGGVKPTLARPQGDPESIGRRPANVPRGVFYRCDGPTKQYNSQGTHVCGPVGQQ